MYDHSWKYRCPICDKPATNEHGIKIHLSRKKNSCKKYLWEQNKQNFKGTVAEKKAVARKLHDQQKERPAVQCEGTRLKNVFLFKYLGSIFAANGSQEPDVKRRIGIATTRMGQLRHLFNSTKIQMNTKLRLYEAAVVSLFTYGCEAWALTPKTIQQLNGANSRMLKRFTNKTTHEEARNPTYDLIKSIRHRRLCWLGHILRLEKIKTPDGEGECERLIKVAVKHQHSEKYVGSLLMDAPDMTWEELTAKAEDKKAWRKLVKQLKPTKPWTKTVASDESDEDESCLYKPGPGETAPDQQWDSLTQLRVTLGWQKKATRENSNDNLGELRVAEHSNINISKPQLRATGKTDKKKSKTIKFKLVQHACFYRKM